MEEIVLKMESHFSCPILCNLSPLRKMHSSLSPTSMLGGLSFKESQAKVLLGEINAS
jgi:hypothetical protein